MPHNNTTTTEEAAFNLGKEHALQRGPKSQTGINQVNALTETERSAYLRGSKAGLELIVNAK